MEIKMILENKKQYLDLLLLADEQEDMIDKYLECGEMFGLCNDELKSICVVTCERTGVYELKNIATYEKYQRQGYGKKLVAYILEYYKNKGKTMFVGTGDSPRVVSFYEQCGFSLSHRVKNFFVDNYDHPIFDSGIQLVDMVYLKKNL